MSRLSLARVTVLAAAVILPRAISWGLPLVDMHSVRETQTAMITRNLLADDFAIGRTRIDWNGNDPSVVVQELPIYQAAVAVVWKLAGSRDAWGRVLSTFATIPAAVALWLLLERLVGATGAFWGTLWFLLCPIVIYAGDAFLPNMLSMAMVLGGIALLLRWKDRPRSVAAGAAAALLLITAWLMNEPLVAAFGGVLVWAFWPAAPARGPVVVRTVLVLVALVATVAWGRHVAATNAGSYAQWNLPTLLRHFFAPEESRISGRLWFRSAAYLFFFVLGPAGPAWIALGGRALLKRAGEPRIVAVAWSASIAVYYLVFLKALSGHNYYTLPATPLFALLFAAAATDIGRAWPRYGAVARAAVAAGCVATIAWLPLPVVHARTLDTTAYDAGRLVDRTCRPDTLILVAPLHTNVANEMYPTVLYYAHRRGWNVGTPEWNVETLLAQVRQGAGRGAACLVVTTGPAFEPSPLRTMPGFRLFAHETNQAAVPAALAALGSHYPLAAQAPNMWVFALDGRW